MNQMLTEYYICINKFTNFNENLNTDPENW